jgi:hypothetical protein
MEQWNDGEERRWDVGLNGFHPTFQFSDIPLFQLFWGVLNIPSFQ